MVLHRLLPVWDRLVIDGRAVGAGVLAKFADTALFDNLPILIVFVTFTMIMVRVIYSVV